jgi:hypothetical protein
MLRWGRATLVVLCPEVPDAVVVACRVARRGVHLAFVQRMDELVRMLDVGTVGAVAICPPQRTSDSLVVAAALRRRAPGLPVAVVLGPSRLDGGEARVLWLAEHAVPAAITSAVVDLAQAQRGAAAARSSLAMSRTVVGVIDVPSSPLGA